MKLPQIVKVQKLVDTVGESRFAQVEYPSKDLSDFRCSS